jgi:SAM-dependent methyltransferase
VSEREAFLRGFHAAHPGITSAVLARGTSYDRLAALVPAGARVLDLGCGDGHLLTKTGGIGVDLSAAELAIARRRGAAVVQGRAQALPFADAAFDLCVCHLALMLMDELDLVASEVARVARSFAAIVGGGPTASGDDAFHRFLRLPLATIPRLGDRRASSEAGWRALFPGFAIDFERLELDLSGPVDDVWRVLDASYQRGASREQFDAATADLVVEGALPLAMVVWLARASR